MANEEPINKGHGIYTYTPAMKDQFAEGGDAWEALDDGRQVTLNKDGMIIDIWDPVTKKTYDVMGHEIGSRDTPYAAVPDPELKDMSDAELEAARLSVISEYNQETNMLSPINKARVAKKKRLSAIVRQQTARKKGYQKRAPKAKLPKYKLTK